MSSDAMTSSAVAMAGSITITSRGLALGRTTTIAAFPFGIAALAASSTVGVGGCGDCALAGTMSAPLARRISRQIKSMERRMESHGWELAEETDEPRQEALGVPALKHTTPRN